MSDENDSRSSAAAESEDRSSSKKKDKTGSKKRKESSEDSSKSSKKSKDSDKSKSDKSSKSKEKGKKDAGSKKEGSDKAEKDGKPKAKKAKGKKKPLFYGTSEDRYLLRSRDLLLRQASIKRLIKAILMRDEMVTNLRISKIAVIALHTLVNAYIQHRFKASKINMENVNPKRKTLSVNYVKASYLDGELYMGREPNLPETYLVPPEKKLKIQNGPLTCFLEKVEEDIRKDFAEEHDKEPTEAEIKKEARKRYEALPKTEKKKYEKMAEEREDKEGGKDSSKKKEVGKPGKKSSKKKVAASAD